MNICFTLLFSFLPYIFFLGLLVALFFIATSRSRHKSAEYISLWITLGTLCLIGLQTSFTYQQFQASEKPNIGVELQSINFAKDGEKYKEVINVDGNIKSKLLSSMLLVANYGGKPGFIEKISINFRRNKKLLSLTSPDWENLPLYPNQIMRLALERPISNHDFDRIGFDGNEVRILLSAYYVGMLSHDVKYKIINEYKYQAASENFQLVKSRFSKEYSTINLFKNVDFFNKGSTDMAWWTFLLDLIKDLFVAVLIFLLGLFWESIPKTIRQARLKRFFGSAIQKERSAIVYGTLIDPRPRTNGHGNAILRFEKRFQDGRVIAIAGPFENIVGDCEIRSASYLAQSIGKLRKGQIKILSDVEAYKDLDQTFMSLGSPASNEISGLIMNDNTNIFYRFNQDRQGCFIESIGDNRQFRGFESAAPKDIGVVIRLKNNRFPDKFLFVCAGLGEWGTSGASWYLANYWEKLHKEFGDQEFAIIVEVGLRSDSSAKRIDSLTRAKSGGSKDGAGSTRP